MTETIFESKFHKQYVGGEGVIQEVERKQVNLMEFKGMTYEDILREYRWYVRDPKATLPEEIEESLAKLGKTQIDG